MRQADALGRSEPGVAVVGAGPAGLMAAEVLAGRGVVVRVYDRMPSAGRKVLLAGRGGLNITHGEPFDAFCARYGAATDVLRPHLRRWTPTDLRAWSAALGQETFVGSSGRVFPACFKTSPLLRAWLRRLAASGVVFMPRHHWTGWDEAGRLSMATPEGLIGLEADATILALGGASWPQLGSDGTWQKSVRAAGIEVTALQPANCGFAVAWSPLFRDRFEGHPLKGIALSFEGRVARGEAMVTRAGLEGNAVYALSNVLREAVTRRGTAILHIALRPDLPPEVIQARWLKRRPGQSLSTALRKELRLAPAAIALLREAERSAAVPLPQMTPETFAAFLNAVPIAVGEPMPIARAISTAGGVPFRELDASLMAQRRPGLFFAGEMLDWEAPTGGYLLQACFATGVAAAEGALAWLARPEDGKDRLRRRSAGPSPS